MLGESCAWAEVGPCKIKELFGFSNHFEAVGAGDENLLHPSVDRKCVKATCAKEQNAVRDLPSDAGKCHEHVATSFGRRSIDFGDDSLG